MIQLERIDKSFGDKHVLRDLDATLPDGGVVWITGASGTGKTTLLRILAGLIRPDGGAVSGLEGRRIGFVFQEDRLLPWRTALENVALVSDLDAARRYLNALDLEDAHGLYPGAMSGGMKRRTAIARALAYTGDVLLLDEPFTGLDPDNRARAAEAIRARTKLVFLVTHESADLALFDITGRVELQESISTPSKM